MVQFDLLPKPPSLITTIHTSSQLTPALTPIPSPIAIDTLSLKGHSQLLDRLTWILLFLANFNSSYDILFYCI